MDSDSLISQFSPSKPAPPPSEAADPDSLIKGFAPGQPQEPGLNETTVGGLGGTGASRLKAMSTGAARGLTLGYSDNLLPKDYVDAANEHPIISALSSFFPASAAMKGAEVAGSYGASKLLPDAVQAAGKTISNLPGAGAVGDIVKGGSLGYAYNPGENGNRATNGIIGAGANLGLGLVGDVFDGSTDSARAYKDLYGEDQGNSLSDRVGSSYRKALQSLKQKEIIDPSNEKDAILQNSGPVTLDRGAIRNTWERRATPRPGSTPLPDIDDILAGQGIPKNATSIPANTAENAKQYFQGRADYSPNTRGQPAIERASSERDARLGSLFKGLVEGADPRVGPLNGRISNGYAVQSKMGPAGVTSNVNGEEVASPYANPVGAVKAAPDSLTGQNVRELDRLAGSDLSGMGEPIRDAVAAKEGPTINWHSPGKSIHSLTAPARVWAGSLPGAGPVGDILKAWPKESVIDSFLSGQKRKDQNSQR